MAVPKFGALTQLRAPKRETESDPPSPSPSPPQAAETITPPPVHFPGRLAVLRENGATPSGTTPTSCYANTRRRWPTASWRMREQTRICPSSSSGCWACICAVRLCSFRRSKTQNARISDFWPSKMINPHKVMRPEICKARISARASFSETRPLDSWPFDVPDFQESGILARSEV